MMNFMLLITFLGNWKTVLCLSSILAVGLIINKKFRLFIMILISSLSNLVIVEPLKQLIREPRPLHSLIAESSFSFPSGHAYTAVTFYGLLTYLVYKKTKNIFVAVSGTMFVLLICYSRLYLGVHYLHDILASLFLGTLVLILETKLFKQ